MGFPAPLPFLVNNNTFSSYPDPQLLSFTHRPGGGPGSQLWALKQDKSKSRAHVGDGGSLALPALPAWGWLWALVLCRPSVGNFADKAPSSHFPHPIPLPKSGGAWTLGVLGVPFRDPVAYGVT